MKKNILLVVGFLVLTQVAGCSTIPSNLSFNKENTVNDVIKKYEEKVGLNGIYKYKDGKIVTLAVNYKETKKATIPVFSALKRICKDGSDKSSNPDLKTVFGHSAFDSPFKETLTFLATENPDKKFAVVNGWGFGNTCEHALKGSNQIDVPFAWFVVGSKPINSTEKYKETQLVIIQGSELNEFAVNRKMGHEKDQASHLAYVAKSKKEWAEHKLKSALGQQQQRGEAFFSKQIESERQWNRIEDKWRHPLNY